MKKPVPLYRQDQQSFYILLLQLLPCFSCHILYFANITFIFLYTKRTQLLPSPLGIKDTTLYMLLKKKVISN